MSVQRALTDQKAEYVVEGWHGITGGWQQIDWSLPNYSNPTPDLKMASKVFKGCAVWVRDSARGKLHAHDRSAYTKVRLVKRVVTVRQKVMLNFKP